ncbi:MAG: hypothetical protein KDA16_05805 [Phycisphaerales bacterium]|nr:hypothetical protein [Phycisphaerales bacterium]
MITKKSSKPTIRTGMYVENGHFAGRSFRSAETFEASDIETVYSMAAGARKSFTRGPGGVAFRHVVTLANQSVHASPLLNHDAMLAVDRALTERVIQPRVKAALAEIEAGHEVRFRCFKERDARKRKTVLYTVVLTQKSIHHEDKRGIVMIEWKDLARLGAYVQRNAICSWRLIAKDLKDGRSPSSASSIELLFCNQIEDFLVMDSLIRLLLGIHSRRLS